MKDYPFYDLVPKDSKANVEWRYDIVMQCRTDMAARQDFFDMCSRDILFYVNTFCYTLNPRDAVTPLIPFITYEYQDEALIKIMKLFGKEDILIEKSRDMGATWMNLLPIEWHWHFRANLTFLLGSRKEEYVEKKGDEKALFSKIDLVHRYLPEWLMPAYDRRMLHLRNADNGSTIDGESTTGDFARGDRRTVILLDEFAAVERGDGYRVLKATRAVTQCRIFNSTYQGINNAFYETSQIVKNKLSFHWSKRPEFRSGLYKSTGGKLEILDHSYRFPSDYNFILDGKTRSPWYDTEEARCANSQEMAQEVDMKPLGGDYNFFDLQMIERLRAQCPRPPVMRGAIINNNRGGVECWEDNEKGMCSLWKALDLTTNRAPAGTYGIGIDVATGIGATNSTMSVANMVTGEKVAELRDPNTLPYKWAELAVAVATVFHDAKLCWEANGPGREFGLRIKELGYSNIYYRENIDTHIRSNFAGWWSDKETKRVLLAAYRQALADGSYINRSARALSECCDYLVGSSGEIEHMPSRNTEDPTGARDNHGDLVIADACSNWLMKNRVAVQSDEEEYPDTPNCLWSRIKGLLGHAQKASQYEW